MAYKDEYEVARPYADGAFLQRLRAHFEGGVTLRFHLAPPLLANRNERGELVKREFGPWMMGVFRVLAQLKGLRGTALDPFGYTEERRTERALAGARQGLWSRQGAPTASGPCAVGCAAAALALG